MENSIMIEEVMFQRWRKAHLVSPRKVKKFMKKYPEWDTQFKDEMYKYFKDLARRSNRGDFRNGDLD